MLALARRLLAQLGPSWLALFCERWSSLRAHIVLVYAAQLVTAALAGVDVVALGGRLAFFEAGHAHLEHLLGLGELLLNVGESLSGGFLLRDRIKKLHGGELVL